MIKLSGSRFTDIMPENLASQAEVQAIAYAVGRQVEKLCAYSDAARTYAAIATPAWWIIWPWSCAPRPMMKIIRSRPSGR